MNEVPVIRTERLLLREPALGDWPGFAGVMTSDRARHMGGPFSTQVAWGDFCQGIALWRLFGLGHLSIELRETGDCIGRIEINQGPRYPEPELGWQVQAAAEGRGYAHEAAVALRDWVFHEGKLRTLVSYIGPENARSIRLAERLGAVLDAWACPQDLGDLVYRHGAGHP